MGAAAAAGAGAAAMIQAVKASGAIVRVEPAAFERLLAKQPGPLVVMAQVGMFSRKNGYLMSYKGLAFYCESASELALPSGTELVAARKIWIPG